MQPIEYLSDKTISVRENDGNWIIAGKLRTVVLDSSNFEIVVETKNCKWSMLPSNEMDLTLGHDGESFHLSLLRADRIDISTYDTGSATGMKIDLDGFKHNDIHLDLGLQLIIALDGGSEELVFSVVPKESSTTVIEKIRWPKAFSPEENDITAVPLMQGMLLPNDWPKKAWLFEPDVCYGRGLAMPWWGHQKGDSSVLVILETPDDVGCNFAHPAGGPTFIEPLWHHSLGRFSYIRRLRMCFIDNGNYVDMSKRYRQYVKDKGRFVSLEEKIARKPLLEKLIGSPVFHPDFVAWHCDPRSLYYDKENIEANDRVAAFDERADEVKRIAALGIRRLYIHQDGWGYRGYDNQHPDILPPSPEAGGWDGMRRYADVCDKLGFIFAVHDNYRDYYHNAASYQLERSTVLKNGKHPYESTWTGGPQNILCSSFAPDYVRRNYSEILRQGVKVNGAYLDVFSIVPADECYDPNHPVSRSECLKYRAECFSIISSLAGIVSSEEPTDWAIPHLDLVHHAPYALDPNPGGGPALGVPVPLFSLVYHDSIFVPWAEKRGGWGIPEDDFAYLHGLLNAGIPYIAKDPTDEQLDRVKMTCGLSKRVGLLEMTKHEFLDSSYRKQRTTFADGTTVTVDFNADTVEITPELSENELNWALS